MNNRLRCEKFSISQACDGLPRIAINFTLTFVRIPSELISFHCRIFAAGDRVLYHMQSSLVAEIHGQTELSRELYFNQLLHSSYFKWKVNVVFDSQLVNTIAVHCVERNLNYKSSRNLITVAEVIDNIPPKEEVKINDGHGRVEDANKHLVNRFVYFVTISRA